MRRSRGIGMIEVLVALFVLAIGVLGAAAMQMNAIKFNQAAAVRSQATFLAYEIADRMRANRAAALAGAYDLAPEAEAPAGTGVAAADLRDWRAALANRLPAGGGGIRRDGAAFEVLVRWDEGRLGDAGDDTLREFRFSTGL